MEVGSAGPPVGWEEYTFVPKHLGGFEKGRSDLFQQKHLKFFGGVRVLV